MSRIFLSTIAAVILLFVPVTVAAEPRPAGSCENVAGTVQGYAIPIIEGGEIVGFDVSSTSVTGSLAGSFVASIVVEKITPGGAVHFNGMHTLETNVFGTLTTSDKGTVAPNGRLHNHLTIVEGGSGSFHSHGTVDSTTGFVDGWYHGRICTG